VDAKSKGDLPLSKQSRRPSRNEGRGIAANIVSKPASPSEVNGGIYKKTNEKEESQPERTGKNVNESLIVREAKTPAGGARGKQAISGEENLDLSGKRQTNRGGRREHRSKRRRAKIDAEQL